jgi:hypothetical protein
MNDEYFGLHIFTGRRNIMGRIPNKTTQSEPAQKFLYKGQQNLLCKGPRTGTTTTAGLVVLKTDKIHMRWLVATRGDDLELLAS